jgi:two-component system OmpR family response regulator
MTSTWHDRYMPIKLLIVEHSQPIRASLRCLLSRIDGIAGIYEATSLDEAMECAQQVVPDLVILDLHLPDGLGIQIIGRLRQLSPNLQVAVLTNQTPDGYRQRCMELGAHWFFDKATEFEALLDVARQQAALSTHLLPNQGDPC